MPGRTPEPANRGVTVRAPSEPVKGGAVDIEEFAKNLARMVEEGGKALAAYLKPREEGQRRRSACRGHRRGQDARPGRGILAGRSAARARAADRASARPISISGRNAVKRMAGEEVDAGRRARPARQALRRSGMVEQPVLRFPQAGLSAHRALGRPPGRGRRGARPAHPAEGRVLRAPDRQRARRRRTSC